MPEINPTMLTQIRRASRVMVRKFGFMNRTLAGTEYSPSAVHAIIDIGRNDEMTAKELSDQLYLEKSSISRLVSKLIKFGEVEETKSATDARQKNLSLTPKGRETLRGIHSFGEAQVSAALSLLDKHDQNTVLKGMQIYADALNPDHEIKSLSEITIHKGYRRGLIGKISALHVEIHGEIAGLDMPFEILVANGMSEFMPRADHEKNGTWYAQKNNKIVGGITIDGEDLGNNIAHLRWFVLDTKIQSAGIGRKLLEMAMVFCESQGFDEVHLWTYKGLDAARRLYENHGFMLEQEERASNYGIEVTEQMFVKRY